MAVEDGATTGTGTPEGQASAVTPGTGTTGAAPKGGEGQPGKVADAGTTGQTPGTQQPDEDTFFDPKELDPKLIPAYKNLQKAWTKKTEALAKDRAKVDAYNNFERDPIGTMQNMAARMGYRLTPAQAAAAAAEAQAGAVPDNWEPKTWGEVISKMGEMLSPQIKQGLMKELSPILSEVTELRKSNIEKMLDDNVPDWRQYEDQMKDTLRTHPTLVSDPVKLYRLSVPEEVLESRATQKALAKLESKVKGAGSPGTSTTTRHQATNIGDKAMTFQQAVEFAKADLAQKGIRPPGGS
jgi:hypothetical protein